MNFKALSALGDKLQSEGKFDQALKVFKQAEAMADSPAAKATAANRQGKVLLDARRPPESIPYFEQAVKDQPNRESLFKQPGFQLLGPLRFGQRKGGGLEKSRRRFLQSQLHRRFLSF